VLRLADEAWQGGRTEPHAYGGSLGGSAADFTKFIADETEKWAKVIRTANIKPE
jgi:hypothetical protein